MKVFIVESTVRYEDTRTYDIPEEEALLLIASGHAILSPDQKGQKPKAPRKKKE